MTQHASPKNYGSPEFLGRGFRKRLRDAEGEHPEGGTCGIEVKTRDQQERSNKMQSACVSDGNKILLPRIAGAS